MQIKIKSGHVLVKVGDKWEIWLGDVFYRHLDWFEQAILEAVLKK